MLEALNDILSKLITPENFYKNPKKIKELRFKAIKAAHKHHFRNNAYYHKMCKSKDIGEDITEKDLPQLLIPDKIFKSYPMEFPEDKPLEFKNWLAKVTSVNIDGIKIEKTSSLEELLAQFYEEGILLGFSSGTTGTLTFLPRDKYTQSMLIKSYVASVDSSVQLNKGKDYFVLGIPEKTFLQVGWNGKHVAEAISPRRVFYGFGPIKADMIRMRNKGPKNFKEKVINKLASLMLPRLERDAIKKMVNKLVELKGQRVIFLAPPFMIVETARYILENGINAKLTEDSIVASTGGFKGHAVTSREEMNKLIEEAFGISSNHYLDLYGMTESNSIIMECTEANLKHIPPWKEVFLFDENLEVIEPDGKVTGRYGFIEPSSTSFPGFILTGDQITVDWDGCSKCEKITPVVLSIGRLPTEEGRGCSGVLAKTVGES